MSTNIPKIRNKKFNGAWQDYVLGNIIDIRSVKRIHQNEWRDKGIRFLRARDIVAEFKKENFEDFLYIDEEKYKENIKETGGVKAGDVLVTGVGTIGIPKLINDNTPLYFKDGNVLWFKNDNAIDGKFLYYQFIGKRIQSYINNISGVGTVGTYTIKDAKNTNIILVSKEEQLFIGNFLQNIDDLIDTESKKLQKLKDLKSAMLTKMFPKKGRKVPEIRFKGFSGEWEEQIFGKTVSIERGGSPRPIEKFITKDSNGLNWIKIGDAPKYGNYIIGTEEKIIPEGLSKTKQVHPNDLILSNSMSFGKPYILKIDGCIHDGWLLIRNDKNIYDLDFLCLLLSSDNIIKQYKSLAAGSTVNNLNKDLVSNVVICFPEIFEQKVIGKYFKDLNLLIEKEQQKLEKLTNLKQAFLSKMFV